MRTRNDSTTIKQPPILLGESPPESAVTLLFYCRDDVRAVPLAAGQDVVVGRAFPSQLVFDERSLSRQHARIGFERDRLRVRDLKSTNRVWVNGEAVEEAELQVGDAVRLGSLTVTLEPATPAAGFERPLMPYRAFKGHVDRELERAREYGRPVAVLVVRKRGAPESINDWCPAVARHLRCADAAAIYGANALIVQLAETDADGAQAWALGLARALDQPLVFGVAVQPSAATGTEALIGAAREALARADESAPVHIATTADARPDAASGAAAEVVSKPMQALHKLSARVARSRLHVLILGETGTGKEVLAHRVHRHSLLSGGPFKVLNCAALAPSLMEDTFFGHEPGAFTGASKGAPGLFEQAHGGTLFLDEVGELSLSAQAALLRVLEARVVTRLGGRREIPADARIIAATNRDLAGMVTRGDFREDLLHRLNAVTLTVPALRDRREEIPYLAAHFLRNDRLPADRPTSIAPEAMARLVGHGWPGNLRELRNVIERAAVVALGSEITIADLPDELTGDSEPDAVVGAVASPPAVPEGGGVPAGGEPAQSLRERVLAYEMALIDEALRATQGHRANAAKRLNMPLRTLMTRLQNRAKA